MRRMMLIIFLLLYATLAYSGEHDLPIEYPPITPVIQPEYDIEDRVWLIENVIDNPSLRVEIQYTDPSLTRVIRERTEPEDD